MDKTLKIKLRERDLALYEMVYEETKTPWTISPLKMYVMCPILMPRNKDSKRPLLIWVVGGAWKTSNAIRCIPELAYYAKRGYVVASIEYQVSGFGQFPEPVQNVKTAIRYLKAHADYFGIDKTKVALMGGSAGGHLVALAGASYGVKEFTTESWAEETDEVQAVVDMYGPADLLSFGEYNRRQLMNDPASAWKIPEALVLDTAPQISANEAEHAVWRSPEALFLGAPADVNPELAEKASPITYVSEDTPPFLILHGTEDKIVPIAQSEALYHALTTAGTEAELYRIEEAGHAGAEFNQEEVKEIIADFLDRHLKE